MENLTNEIKRILDLPVEEVNITEAATLLLRINRNKILFNNLIRRNWVEKALYELKKYYDFRMKDHSIKETAEMEVEVKRVIENNPKITQPEDEKEESQKGMREDHEKLPDEIKALYVENLNIFRRMRKLHEQLKLMNDQKPCDRYPFLKEMLDLDNELRGNWHYYDTYVIGTPIAKQENIDVKKNNVTDQINSVLVADPKLVSAARKYLSTNKAKVVNLVGEAREALLQKMQERYSYLVATESGISDEQKAEYKALGLNV